MSANEIRQVLLDSRTDITFEWEGREFRMYHDEAQATAETDAIHIYDRWEELLEAPVFWGKTLDAIEQDTVCRY